MRRVDHPLVSIGLPLYNAGEQTRAILDNLLAQEYANFELVISDNASPDDTWAICQDYAARDARIRLYQNTTNLGYMFNFERVLQLATGVYFMWAAHDDYWDAKFISSCVKQLEAHPNAIFCLTNQVHIHAQTSERSYRDYAALRLASPSISTRIRSLLAFRPRLHALMYGMFRREAIISLLPLSRVPSTEIVFLTSVMAKGQGIHMAQVLYKRNVTLASISAHGCK